MQKKNTETKFDMANYANVEQVAKLCNCSNRHIQNLFKEYKAEGKTGRGKYDLAIFIPWYIEFLRSGQKSEDQKSAKERQDEIKAKTAELDYLVKIKELLPKKLIQETIISELKDIAAYVYSIPKKKSIKLLQAQNRTEVEIILDEAIKAAFSRYAGEIEPPKRRRTNTTKTTKRKSTTTKKTSTGISKAKTKTPNKRMGRKV